VGQITGRRSLICERASELVDTTIYRRPAPAARDAVAGPAIIEDYSATIPVHPRVQGVR
jgi:N-methylhydantoinase A/oxoprolinase/acetone carboxylase beta subunit